MPWANCGTDDAGREIGYGVTATCDHSGCTAEIDRGLGHVCGGMHGGDGVGCGRYFCGEHLTIAGHPDEPERSVQMCHTCAETADACAKGNHAWKVHVNPSTPDFPAERVCYCDWCGKERTEG